MKDSEGFTFGEWLFALFMGSCYVLSVLMVVLGLAFGVRAIYLLWIVDLIG